LEINTLLFSSMICWYSPVNKSMAIVPLDITIMGNPTTHSHRESTGKKEFFEKI